MKPKIGPQPVEPGDHVLLVDGTLNLIVRRVNADKHASMIAERAWEAYRDKPGASIVHVVVVATYGAPEHPEVKTLAGEVLS